MLKNIDSFSTRVQQVTGPCGDEYLRKNDLILLLTRFEMEHNKVGNDDAAQTISHLRTTLEAFDPKPV